MILVTGGAGYIGSVLVPALLQKGKKVRVYDKLYFDSDGLEPCLSQIELVPGDVRYFDDSVLDGIEGVIHLGSLSNDPTADFNPKANWDINYEGTMLVAEACKRKGVKRFTLASTCAVYGFHIEGISDEEAPTNPQSEYARSKLEAENGLLKLVDDNFCPVILRQATVYGFSPRMRWDLVVNTFTKDAYDRGRLTVFHGGGAFRPLVDVNDVAKTHILCLEAPEEKVKGQIFNVSHSNFVIIELAHRVKMALREFNHNIEVDVNFGTNESRSYRVTGEKLLKTLGFQPSITVEESARKIYSRLVSGNYVDFYNPRYYNIEWMKLLVEMEQRLSRLGKVF